MTTQTSTTAQPTHDPHAGHGCPDDPTWDAERLVFTSTPPAGTPGAEAVAAGIADVEDQRPRRCGIHGDDTTSGRCATCDGLAAALLEGDEGSVATPDVEPGTENDDHRGPHDLGCECWTCVQGAGPWDDPALCVACSDEPRTASDPDGLCPPCRREFAANPYGLEDGDADPRQDMSR